MTQDKKVTLTLTLEQINKIGIALSALPYRDVAELIALIQTQLNEQAEEK